MKLIIDWFESYGFVHNEWPNDRTIIELSVLHENLYEMKTEMDQRHALQVVMNDFFYASGEFKLIDPSFHLGIDPEKTELIQFWNDVFSSFAFSYSFQRKTMKCVMFDEFFTYLNIEERLLELQPPTLVNKRFKFETLFLSKELKTDFIKRKLFQLIESLPAQRHFEDALQNEFPELIKPVLKFI